MSRDYNEHCMFCDKNNARKLGYGYNELYQCQDCGRCWEVKSMFRVLEAKGIDEKAWKEAYKEVEYMTEDWREDNEFEKLAREIHEKDEFAEHEANRKLDAKCKHVWVYSNIVRTSYPTQHDRICRKCGKTETVSGTIVENDYNKIKKKFEGADNGKD